MVNQQNKKELADWLGDLVVAESEVEEVMDQQLKLEIDDAGLTAAIKTFHDTVRDSKHRLEAFAEGYGDVPATKKPMQAGAELMGKVAGMVQRVRQDSLAKAMRDNNVAYSQLSVSYTMLFTMAKALGDQSLADFAKQGMETYAKLVMEVNHKLPEAVVYDLGRNDDVTVEDTAAAAAAHDQITASWAQ